MAAALWVAILASWGIAFFEYCFQVPANRIGHGQFTAPQLKVLQEVITLLVFAIFSAIYLRERLRWNDWAAFAFILGAVAMSFGFGTPRDPERTTAISNTQGLQTSDLDETL